MPKKTTTLERRAKAAQAVFEAVDAVWRHMDEVPSFTGKAPFMDRVVKARTRAHSLLVNLEMDAAGEAETGGGKGRP